MAVAALAVPVVGSIFRAIGGNTNDQQDREVQEVLTNAGGQARAVLVAWREGVVGPYPIGHKWSGRVNGGATARATHQREVSGRAVQALDANMSGSASPILSIGQIPNVSQAYGQQSTGTAQDTLTAVLQRALAAGEAELATRVAAGAAGIAGNANAAEQRASLVPNVTPQQLAVVFVLVGVLVLLLIMRRRR